MVRSSSVKPNAGIVALTYRATMSARVGGARRVRRALSALGSAALFAGLALTLHFADVGRQMCHPARSYVSAAETQNAHDTLKGLEEASFRAQDGVVLRGWFVPPTNGVVIVLVHGLCANRGLLLPEAEVFARHGYGLLLYDSRAHGTSDGTVATWGSNEARDVAEGVRFVRARPGVSRVVLLGFSVGASAVARAAANDSTISALILYAVWPSLRSEVAYKSWGGWLGAQATLLGMRISGAQIDEITPETDMPRIAPRPVMMLSGGLDDDTPPWVMDRMFSLTSAPKEFWREPTVGHGGYFEADPVEYEKRVVGFLNRALAL
jgi:pimeloyl-ACP methyl ester carboxylesterase